MVVVTLYDDVGASGHLATRVIGFSAAAVPWGIQIGGAEHSRFEKDLAKPPAFRGKGRRFDLAHPDVLTMALDLDCLVERHLRFPYLPRQCQPRWPEFWAAFSPQVAATLSGAGPEFEIIARSSEKANAELLKANSRMIGALVAFPLAFVSHAWRHFKAIFANFRSVPKRQVITLDHQAKNLCGYAGAIEFDLVHSRFATASTALG
jgi:hypothetical protein